MSIAALILAGGKGERVGGNIPKQFHLLASKKLVNYSLEAFDSLEEIEEIVLVLPPFFAEMLQIKMDLKQFGKLKAIASGGELRQDSVVNGLKALSEDVEFVIIHDGARPFPPIKATREAIKSARQFGAAILGIPVTDTVKSADPNNFIMKTMDRRKMWLAQTPQVFRKTVIMEAYRKSRTMGVNVTDDASAVEILGNPVKMVLGSPFNIKITVKEDLGFARQILEYLKDSSE
jgi:2-C-methyl-D-erythritol 4-phosphate cytidylyltransferase